MGKDYSVLVRKRYSNKIKEHGLKANHLFVYSLVKSFHDSGNLCYMSNQEIGDFLCLSKSTVKSVINDLCAKNIINKKEDGPRKRYLYIK